MTYINTCSGVDNKLRTVLLAGRLSLDVRNTIDAMKQTNLCLSYVYILITTTNTTMCTISQ